MFQVGQVTSVHAGKISPLIIMYKAANRSAMFFPRGSGFFADRMDPVKIVV